jgi:hypothetical protein
MKNGMGGTHSTHEEIINAYKTLFGIFEGKRPLGRPRRGGRTIILKWILEK